MCTVAGRNGRRVKRFVRGGAISVLYYGKWRKEQVHHSG